eukprot:1574202-Pleurochrysis_carterae.AAC.1
MRRSCIRCAAESVAGVVAGAAVARGRVWIGSSATLSCANDRFERISARSNLRFKSAVQICGSNLAFKSAVQICGSNLSSKCTRVHSCACRVHPPARFSRGAVARS